MDTVKKMRAHKLVKKRPFRCSLCKRFFDKIENVTCHVTRNAKCSRGGAGIQVRKQLPGPVPDVVKSEEKADLIYIPENREDRDVIVQGVRKKGSPRGGIRF